MARAFVEPRRTTANPATITPGSGLAAIVAARMRRRGGRPDAAAGEAVPVTPDRPLDLSGGAAAMLDFGS